MRYRNAKLPAEAPKDRADLLVRILRKMPSNFFLRTAGSTTSMAVPAMKASMKPRRAALDAEGRSFGCVDRIGKEGLDSVFILFLSM